LFIKNKRKIQKRKEIIMSGAVKVILFILDVAGIILLSFFLFFGKGSEWDMEEHEGIVLIVSSIITILFYLFWIMVFSWGW